MSTLFEAIKHGLAFISNRRLLNYNYTLRFLYLGKIIYLVPSENICLSCDGQRGTKSMQDIKLETRCSSFFFFFFLLHDLIVGARIHI